jgi:signal peptidase II
VNSNLPNIESEATAQAIHQGERLTTGHFALFFLPCLIGLTGDLWTKWFMFKTYFDPTVADSNDPSTYAAQYPHWWVEGIFGIQTSTNPGALFGMGSGLSWLFAIFSFVALAGILIWLFAFRGAFDRWLTFALGMICGGILGNLYDRLGFGFVQGYPESIRTNVRDWILFRLEGVPFFDPWPNFNIADVMLVTGAIMLLIHAFLYEIPDGSMSSSESEPLSVE